MLNADFFGKCKGFEELTQRAEICAIKGLMGDSRWK